MLSSLSVRWPIYKKNSMSSSVEEDEKYMFEALKEAKKAFKQDEVPVGAVLVRKGQIIARGHNQVELLNDATAHAEMLCMTAGEAVLENWRLTDSVLYCTLEPCAMCAGAMFLTRISRLVWGAPDLRHGANGSLFNLFDKVHPIHNIEVRGGVLGDFSAYLLREFFKKRRELE
ncbi:tRNA-specific adenosine deaminase [Chlamydiales bacterium STE3]|nr:tRNA-specific adenosine deaminase [Chlamydiales bacterium STE3]